jgi:thiamine-monophosphate kinase
MNMFNNKEFSHLSDLGEFGLIDHLTSHIQLTKPTTKKGVGDDAAVLAFEPSESIVVTTDMLTEGVHFDLMYTPLKHLGYKAVTVNLSDVIAMNATPSQITVSLGLSSKFTLEAVEELYAGILLACDKYKIDLVGGDTVASKSGLVISITAIGHQNPEKIVYRKGAQPNDLLCLTGDVGGAYLGLQLLEREKRVFIENPNMQPDLDGYDYIIGRQLKPEARIDMIKTFEDMGILPTSMIDVSDGLSSEILHLCKQSNVGIRLYEEKLPFDPSAISLASEFNLNMATCALNGGEDYELLFTIDPKHYEKLKGNLDITIIGHCTDPDTGAKMITSSGQEFDIVAQGWKAF